MAATVQVNDAELPVNNQQDDNRNSSALKEEQCSSRQGPLMTKGVTPKARVPGSVDSAQHLVDAFGPGWAGT